MQTHTHTHTPQTDMLLFMYLFINLIRKPLSANNGLRGDEPEIY
jgi:hypothetical protein